MPLPYTGEMRVYNHIYGQFTWIPENIDRVEYKGD